MGQASRYYGLPAINQSIVLLYATAAVSLRLATVSDSFDFVCQDMCFRTRRRTVSYDWRNQAEAVVRRDGRNGGSWPKADSRFKSAPHRPKHRLNFASTLFAYQAVVSGRVIFGP